MPALAVFASPTIGKDQYEALRNDVAWERMPPIGGTFHAESFDENRERTSPTSGKTPKVLNEFVNTRLGPASSRVLKKSVSD